MPLPDDVGCDVERDRPSGLAVMRQRWTHLLFLHWAWDSVVVQASLPPGLTVDTFGNRAWLGIVPFFMRGVRPAFFPAVPGLSNFMELNVRTYVKDASGRPGVWFYSLDANQWLAVKTARVSFCLPYEHAVMTSRQRADGTVEFDSQRVGAARATRFAYRVQGEVREAKSGSLEYFLVERYRLFAFNPRRQQLLTGRVAHRPYQIGAAVVNAWDGAMLECAGFVPPHGTWSPPDHVCATQAVDVEIFPPRRLIAAPGQI